MQIRGILFDKDGTLIDFSATFEPATRLVLERICGGNPAKVEQAARATGFDLDSETIHPDSPIVAGTSIDIAAVVSSILDVNDVEQLGRDIDRHYGQICLDTVQPLSGAVDALQELSSAGYILGVATNDAEQNAITQMHRLGVARLFERVFGADSGFGQKPGPGMVSAFTGHLGLEASQVLIVGDSLHDLEAGRKAGVRTCGVLTGPAGIDVLQPHADVILPSVSDLPAWLKSVASV